MQIDQQTIPVRDLVRGFKDSGDEGIVGYGGNLDIRPKYQRLFVYKDKQRNAVIDTLTQGFPLNVMYWADNGNGKYEVIDGQQRIISICRYHAKKFSVVRDKKPHWFQSMTEEEQEQFLSYPLTVYFCQGGEREKLKWFQTINIAGEKLSDQELRNAVYCGEWVTDAKRHFSRQDCPASVKGGKYVDAPVLRQGLLETAIRWVSQGDIDNYMGAHKKDTSAEPLYDYFEGVIDWVRAVFPNYRTPMKGVDWGYLHGKFHAGEHDHAALEEEVAQLMLDKDVRNKGGIYAYVLTRKEKHLNLRLFDEADKIGAYERQGGKCAGSECPKAGEKLPLAAMQGDHIIPWSSGGPTTAENCQMLCAECNQRKSDK